MTPHDLDWLAFRYVAGEMAADEALDFERLLAEDQAVRDAVACAVELAQTILVAESLTPQVEPAATVRSAWSQHAAWFALGATACLAVLIAVSLLPRSAAPSRVSPDLAEAWSQRLETSSETPLETDSDFLPLGDASLAAEVPAWMVEAIRSLQGDEPENESELNELMES